MSNANSIDRLEQPLDPNVAQRTASNPMDSVWVAASAGTGKTKVLTDRVLRLLLPRDDGRDGTAPSRILCLTFTKAAANEMALRINEMLGRWAVMQEGALYEALESLLGHSPSPEQCQAAQRLFADVIDCPGGLKIMTIHSFCQSVLGRFPLEAALPPNFTVMDDAQSASMMQRAQSDVLALAQGGEHAGSALGEAVNFLITEMDEKTFSLLIQDVCKERRQLADILKTHMSVVGVYNEICSMYDIDPAKSSHDVAQQICNDPACNVQDLRRAADSMLHDGSKDGPGRGRIILDWLDGDAQHRLSNLKAYTDVFLIKSGAARSTKGFPVIAALKICPEAADILQKEASRLLMAEEVRKRYRSAQMTRDVLLVSQAVTEHFEAQKTRMGMLDFDDLVIRTMALLSGDSEPLKSLGKEVAAQWVMYKLDQGLDHILVDEAQDTNPEQWRIIESLCTEFFSGLGARDDVVRTSFTVGDIKQSIYSFQRAAPEEFKRMQDVFDRKIKSAGQVNRNIALDISFRTTHSVLRVVDSVFGDPVLNEAVGGGVIRHNSHRVGQAGLTELWPLFETEKAPRGEVWAPPVKVKSQQSGAVQLADYIAQNIKGWLDRDEVLPSRGRAIEPGDIMVLVRSRSSFVDQLVRSLKARSIPVSGADRMVLGNQLAVQDLLALAQFCLHPDDDLTLATVLKTPFIGWGEDDLFSLAYNRKGSLWQELCNFDEARVSSIIDLPETFCLLDPQQREATRDYLARLRGRAQYLGAYEFFSYILNMPCPADEHSGLRAVRGRLGEDALDPIEELLNAALLFSRDHVDHLQVFLDHQAHTKTEIKREMDERGGQVRIMTIHGSKGLQAPIVIMPDTILSSAAKKGGRLLWPNKTGMGVPLYSPRKDDDPTPYQRVYQDVDALDRQEYYRLLYVAMTRAADRLYVAGHVGAKGHKSESWYFKIKQAMEADDTCVSEGEVLRIENGQTATADKRSAVREDIRRDDALPPWAHAKAPEEPFPPRPLIPSRPSEDEFAPALSPLKSQNEKRFKRGNVTHKLLQFLPDFDEENREEVARRFVKKNAGDLSDSVRDNIVDEVMNVITAPDYAPFFRQNSMAEVSVTGLMSDNRIVSGQIDRLVVSGNEIWILDYKTNRPPPTDPKDIPLIYKKQMAAYRDSIQEIYPDHIIYCGLLWTDGPRLMILD